MIYRCSLSQIFLYNYNNSRRMKKSISKIDLTILKEKIQNFIRLLNLLREWKCN